MAISDILATIDTEIANLKQVHALLSRGATPAPKKSRSRPRKATAVALTRVIASLLFGVSTTDVATFLAVPASLGAVAFAATVIPAWRATSVDPIVALREE